VPAREDRRDPIVTGSVNEAGRRTLFMLITTWDAANGGPFAAGAITTVGQRYLIGDVG
jgi:hypothetical protein